MNNKTLLILFTLLTCLIWTSCSSDKDADPTKSYIFKEGNFTYNDASAKNNVALSVDFENSDNATITLQNGITGNPLLRIPGVPMQATKDGYTFEAVDKNSDREIVITGVISKETLVANSRIKYTTNLLGKWELKRGNRTMPDTPEAYFLFNVTSATPEGAGTDAMLNSMLPTFVGQMLYKAVDIVTLDFKENGELQIYYKVPAGSTSALPEMEIPLEYFIREGKMHLAIQASLIDEMLPLLIPAESNLNIDDIKALFEKTGNHYALMLNTTIDGDYSEFYIDETLVTKLVPIIINLIPEEGVPIGEDSQLDKEWLSDILNHLGNAKSIKLGLGFDKIKK